MAIATIDDVQDRASWELSEDERRLSGTLLRDVEAILVSRLPRLPDRAARSEPYRDLVVQVEANAVLRVLRNPEGYRQEAEGNYSYSLSAAVASGRLWILDDEWAMLGGRRGASTVAPKIRRPRRGITRTWKEW